MNAISFISRQHIVFVRFSYFPLFISKRRPFIFLKVGLSSGELLQDDVIIWRASLRTPAVDSPRISGRNVESCFTFSTISEV